MRLGACVFCDLFRGRTTEWVVREGPVRAFFPLPDGRLAPGHTLVVPERHVVGVLDADDTTLAATTAMAARVGRAMVRALGATGVNVLNASGPASGQSVDHLHLHVVPRWPDDGASMWPSERSTHAATGDVRQLLAAELARVP